MARNIPQCEWIVNASISISTNPEVTIDGRNCTVHPYESCSECFYSGLTDLFVDSLIVCYSIIMALGFLGNLAVIAIVLSARELRIVINLLLAALAFSDIVITVAMPFSFLNNISYEYRGSVGMCKGVPMIQGTAIMSGIYTLVVVALERYYAIVRPFRNRILNNPNRVIICLCIIWILSACVQIPLVLVLDVKVFYTNAAIPSFEEVESCDEICVNTSQRLCVETWSDQSALLFSYAVLILMYILPLICMSYLYYIIGRTMWKRKLVGTVTYREMESLQRKRKIVKFMIILVAAFAILWGPYFIMHCLREPIANHYLGSYFQMMGHANVAINPILYAYFHRNIRNQATTYLRRASVLLGRQHVQDGVRESNIASTVEGHIASEKNCKFQVVSSISQSNDDLKLIGFNKLSTDAEGQVAATGFTKNIFSGDITCEIQTPPKNSEAKTETYAKAFPEIEETSLSNWL